MVRKWFLLILIKVRDASMTLAIHPPASSIDECEELMENIAEKKKKSQPQADDNLKGPSKRGEKRSKKNEALSSEPSKGTEVRRKYGGRKDSSDGTRRTGRKARASDHSRDSISEDFGPYSGRYHPKGFAGDFRSSPTSSFKVEKFPKSLNPAMHPLTYEKATKKYGSLAVYCRGVNSVYPGRPVLNNCNMIVPHRSLYILVGSSGCGKSTLLYSICGLKTPSQGRVLVLGHPIGTVNIPGYNLGYMPQSLSMLDDLSILESAQLYGYFAGMSPALSIRRANYFLKFFGLPPGYRKISTLSEGQKRRVSLIIAVLHRPNLLILDEPTTGLDPDLRQRVMLFLYSLTVNFSCTIIMTTHYIEEARIADRLSMMRRGKLLIEGPPSEICKFFNSEDLAYIFLELCKIQGEDEDTRTQDQTLMGIISDYLFCRCRLVYDRSSPWIDDLHLQRLESLDSPSHLTRSGEEERFPYQVNSERAAEKTLWVTETQKLQAKLKSHGKAFRGGRAEISEGEDMTVRDPDIPLYDSVFWFRFRYISIFNVLAITRQQILSFLRSPAVLFFFVIPLLEIVLVLSVMGRYPSGIKLAVVDEDTNIINISLGGGERMIVDVPKFLLETLDRDVVTLVHKEDHAEAVENARQRETFGVWKFPQNFTRLYMLRQMMPLLVSKELENASRMIFSVDEADKMITHTVLSMISDAINDIGYGSLADEVSKIMIRIKNPYKIVVTLADLITSLTKNCTTLPFKMKKSKYWTVEWLKKYIWDAPCFRHVSIIFDPLAKFQQLMSQQEFIQQGREDTSKDCQYNVLSELLELDFYKIFDTLCSGNFNQDLASVLKLYNENEFSHEIVKRLLLPALPPFIPSYFCTRMEVHNLSLSDLKDQAERLALYLAKGFQPGFKKSGNTNIKVFEVLCSKYVEMRAEKIITDTLPPFDPEMGRLPIREHYVYGGKEGWNFQQFVAPGMVILIPHYMSSAMAAFSLAQIKRLKVESRYYSAGVTDLELLLGYALSTFLLSLVLVALVFVVVYGVYLIRIEGGPLHVFLYVVLVLLHGWMGISLGLMLSSFTPDLVATVGVLTAYMMPELFLSGAAWPRQAFKPYAYYISLAVPSSGAIELCRDLVNRGLIYASPWFWYGFLIPIGYTILFTGLAVLGFWYRR
ncbi:unnamed protein product [Cyprideis torosa]|uniref:Uncharacterized protein n=1 Tax=Cyprideis torosa TaxID=163714 RepID=A0A7R8WN99_9CRUS|nr:unnamed protein product [Cyprideis torosa]CAG0903767.1 unnamed protein product [Cyprideis torosa]